MPFLIPNVEICIKGCIKKRLFFWLSKKDFLTLAILLGVKGKVLGIDSKRILRPDPGNRTHYYQSYDIFVTIFILLPQKMT